MSFFVSESLKGIISEEDISIINSDKIDKEKVYIDIQSELTEPFKILLKSIRFNTSLDEITATIDNETLSKLFSCHNKKINYSIFLNNNQYMTDLGVMVIKELETNKDNCVTCQIVINK
tara:strand:- start:632 stop:988 length:357 start_codon:yes stop_codon:yes gene_type:complete